MNLASPRLAIDAFTAGAAAERTRITAILHLPQAKTLPQAAADLALGTDRSPAEAKAILNLLAPAPKKARLR